MTGYETIVEGVARVKVPVSSVASREMPVFYNPVMKHNRDISIAVLKAAGKADMQIGLPLGGSGVRAARIILETDKVKELWINDHSSEAVKLIKSNLRLNKLTGVNVSNKDANIFLLESSGFDYIDIDPFGSPNRFLNSSVERISRGGLLAVTATDTGALAGSFPLACKRKYWAEPKRDENMHERGLRILIRKVQLIGVQFEKALNPIYSYSKDHYMRVFFKCEKGKKKCDGVLEQHGMWDECGPLWNGELWDKKIAKKVAIDDFTKTIAEESKINVVGTLDLHSYARSLKLGGVPKMDLVQKAISDKGYKSSRSHFSGTALRSDIPESGFKTVMKRCMNKANRTSSRK